MNPFTSPSALRHRAQHPLFQRRQYGSERQSDSPKQAQLLAPVLNTPHLAPGNGCSFKLVEAMCWDRSVHLLTPGPSLHQLQVLECTVRASHPCICAFRPPAPLGPPAHSSQAYKCSLRGTPARPWLGSDHKVKTDPEPARPLRAYRHIPGNYDSGCRVL